MVKYPWEKDEPEEESEDGSFEEGEGSEEAAFPWLQNEEPEQSSATLNTPLSPEEEAAVQKMVVNARRKPWNGKAQPLVLSYVNTEPEPLDWKLPVGILAGTACLGALAFFLLNQHSEPVAPLDSEPTVASTNTLPPLAKSSIPENSGALIPPADLDAVREKTNKGRANPFKDTLPPPPPPPPPPIVQTVVAPRQAKPLPPPQPIFTGISVAVSGNDRVAIIQVSGLSPAPTVHEVTVGDQVAGWSVKSVTTERTVLVKGNKTLNVPFL
jgi:hypothetical protein